jgi:signal peptidase II
VPGWNRGITFGLFNHEAKWQSYVFVVAAVIILAFLFNWMMRAASLATTLGLAMVMGGAIGNMIDRLRFGAVADFIDFHIGAYHWYAFNAADSFIVCGVAVLLIEHLATAIKRG